MAFFFFVLLSSHRRGFSNVKMPRMGFLKCPDLIPVQSEGRFRHSGLKDTTSGVSIFEISAVKALDHFSAIMRQIVYLTTLLKYNQSGL